MERGGDRRGRGGRKAFPLFLFTKRPLLSRSKGHRGGGILWRPPAQLVSRCAIRYLKESLKNHVFIDLHDSLNYATV